jgi:hypothetical protein
MRHHDISLVFQPFQSMHASAADLEFGAGSIVGSIGKVDGCTVQHCMAWSLTSA